jgi:hypothetical protein
VDGSELTGFADWLQGEPVGDDRCATFDGTYQRWITDTCVGPVHHYICSGYISKFN